MEIVAAAVRIHVGDTLKAETWMGERVYPDYLIVTAPPPARHHTLMHPLTQRVGPSDQGFITSTGAYVDREEALRIAKASGQPMITHGSRHATQLFSEDLW